jgi:tyrosyl-tRNA synthetase
MGTHQLYALTSDLVTTSSGAKMGKTASGAIWLSADLLSPYDFWQFWRNVADDDIGRFLRLFTVMPLNEIERLEQLRYAEANEAKIILATEVTALIHGREAAEQAADTAHQTFAKRMVSQNLPTVRVSGAMLSGGLSVLVAFGKDYARLVNSNSEARRQIRNGGIKVNGQTITNEQAILTIRDLTAENFIELSLGKRHVLLRPE